MLPAALQCSSDIHCWGQCCALRSNARRDQRNKEEWGEDGGEYILNQMQSKSILQTGADLLLKIAFIIIPDCNVG